MSQPEISQRCPSCGASVRDRDALYCPECGKPLAQAAEPKTTAAIEPAPPETVANESSDLASTSSVNEPPAAVPIDAAAAVADKNESAPASPRRGEKTRERLHRASEVAREVTRGVIEEPARRVEKIRQASTVVIEEASYDPSLRFVLVAVVLFVVFLILLILSKVMG